MKKIRPEVDVWAYLGLNVKIRLNHTIWGSFESAWALENGKNNEKNFVSKSGRLGTFGFKCQKSSTPYYMGLIRMLLGPRKRKNNEKMCPK